MTGPEPGAPSRRTGTGGTKPLGTPVLVDVTLRDGGYVNGHDWSPAAATAAVRAADQAGLAWTEVGYYRPHADEQLPPAARCPAAYLEALAAVSGTAGLVVMAHPGQIRPADLRQLPECGVGMIRFPTSPNTAEEVLTLLTAAREVGLQACLNIIRVNGLPIAELDRMLAAADRGGATAVYIADSNSSLLPDRTADLVARCAAAGSIPVGFHAHDGLSLAFANSLAALQAGATFLDASLGGVGKGGGNLASELIAPYLRHRHGLPYRLRPLAEALATIAGDVPAADPEARGRNAVHGLLDLDLDAIASMARRLPDGGVPAYFDDLTGPIPSSPGTR